MIAAWLATQAGKWIAGLLLIGTVLGGGAWIHHHIYHQGELAADARNAVINKANSDRANAERNLLNGKIALAQSNLTAARATLAVLQKEYDDEKVISNQRHADLLAGRERMRVLARQRPANPNRPAEGGSAGPVDQGAEIVVDLAGSAAAAIDQLRVDRNEAIRRLEACIVKYDAVKAAADAMP